MRKHSLFSLLAAAVVVVFLAAGVAQADGQNSLNETLHRLLFGDDGHSPENLLQGHYAFSGEASCLESKGGFHSDLTPADAPAPFPRVNSFSVQGVATFNGDGTGSRAVRVVAIRQPFALPTSPAVFNRGGASSVDVEADFTYQVAVDRRIRIHTPLVTGTVLSGSRAGQTFEITNFPDFVGLISQDHKTLTIAHDRAIVERQTYSNGDVFDRICHRSRIAFKLKDGNRTGGED